MCSRGVSAASPLLPGLRPRAGCSLLVCPTGATVRSTNSFSCPRWTRPSISLRKSRQPRVSCPTSRWYRQYLFGFRWEVGVVKGAGSRSNPRPEIWSRMRSIVVTSGVYVWGWPVGGLRLVGGSLPRLVDGAFPLSGRMGSGGFLSALLGGRC